MESGNRKLIRPSFSDFKEKSSDFKEKGNDHKEKAEPHRKSPPSGPAARRAIPPDQTNAENFYYVKQMQAKTRMAITLKDGEVIRGYIEWYDRGCLKVNREGEPNLLLYKSNIKYMFKDGEV